jgi:glutamyl-tRNA(Gln) amidotransferase subunit E
VQCVTAEGLGGLLGHEPYPGIRLGKELAEIARTNSLGGVIHSDEFRKQKISVDEEAALRRLTGAGERDALVLVAGPRERVEVVSSLVGERLGAAVKGVPKETRAATDDGETRYLRPRPGAARMYPETDIPEILVTEATLEDAARLIPAPWEEKVRSYVDRYSLSPDLALRLYDSGDAQTFEGLASELKLEPSVVASVLVELPVRLAREGISEERMNEDLLAEVLRSMDRGEFAKEAAVDVLRSVCKGESASVSEAVANLGLAPMDERELAAAIDDIVLKNASLIAEKGDRSFSVLMGEVMKTVRGRADGEVVSRLLRERISRQSSASRP